jgi:hypothetical protein
MRNGDSALQSGIRAHERTVAVATRRGSTRDAIKAELALFKRAIRFYDAASIHDPDSALAVAKLAVASALHERQGNTRIVATERGVRGVYAIIRPGTLMTADVAVAKAPDDPEIRAYRAWVRFVAHQARVQKATIVGGKAKGLEKLRGSIIIDLDIAIAAGKGLPRALVLRCYCHFYNGEYAKALADARAAQKHGGTPQPRRRIVRTLEDKTR